MKKSGQALVEFIIIMPVMLFIMLGIIDFGNYSYTKNNMEGILNNVDTMYQNNKSIEEIRTYVNRNNKNITFDILNEENYIKLVLKENIEFITPGIDKIINIDNITVERIIYNEEK